MRSDLVFGAMAHVPNRFLLTKLASQAIRKLHRPNARIQETANDVFVRFRRANPMADDGSTFRSDTIRRSHHLDESHTSTVLRRRDEALIRDAAFAPAREKREERALIL